MHTCHLTILEIFKYFKKICETNKLKYFLVFGSLLGAIRNNGIIPHDDDIDVCMPRDDYNKFLLILKNSNNNKFKVQNVLTDKNSGIWFTKIIKFNPKFKEHNKTKCKLNISGFFIDIFPIDHVSNSKFLEKINITIIRYLIFSNYKHINCKKYFLLYPLYWINYFFLILFGLTNEKKIYLKINKLQSKFNNDNSCKYYAIKGFFEYKKTKLLKTNYQKNMKIKFNNTMASIFINYSSILKKQFGKNYLQLPKKKFLTTKHFKLKIYKNKQKHE